jgi:phage gp16-like protein
MRAGVEIPWTKDTVKQQLYKPILKALTLKTSTTEQSTVEPTEVVEILSKFLVDRVGVPAPEWPSRG